MTLDEKQTPDSAPESEPTGPVTQEQEAVVARTPLQLAWRRLRKDRVAMISVGFIVFMILVAVFAPVFSAITGHPPNEQYRQTGLSQDGLPIGPNGEFWFGTDELGRDILVRIAYGAQISLGIGVLATLLTVVIGVVLGIAAGYFGGWVDILIARLIDVVLSLPFLMAAVALVSIFGASLTITVLVIGFFGWASVARVVRGQVLSLKEREFVEGARSLGSSNVRIMFVDLLPNVMAPVIIYSSLLVPASILAQAALSFLGLGLQPPRADWGGMISTAQGYYQQAPWYLAFPGLFLVLTTLALNLLGDGVRDALDPRIDRVLAK